LHTRERAGPGGAQVKEGPFVSNEIGLAQFIAQVKRELLDDNNRDAQKRPLLLVDNIELEVQITTSKDAKGGIKVQVLAASGELGAGLKREDTHKVRLTLSPIMTHPERAAALRETDQWASIREDQIGITKGPSSPNQSTA
jgi:hypothetical protein